MDVLYMQQYDNMLYGSEVTVFNTALFNLTFLFLMCMQQRQLHSLYGKRDCIC